MCLKYVFVFKMLRNVLGFNMDALPTMFVHRTEEIHIDNNKLFFQAKGISSVLRDLTCQHVCYVDDKLQIQFKSLCQEFLSYVNGNCDAFSAGGLFYLTKDYGLTVIGLLDVVIPQLNVFFLQMVGCFFTYFLLIYQIKDSKHDLQNLVTKDVLNNDMERLKKFLYQDILNRSNKFNITYL